VEISFARLSIVVWPLIKRLLLLRVESDVLPSVILWLLKLLNGGNRLLLIRHELWLLLLELPSEINILTRLFVELICKILVRLLARILKSVRLLRLLGVLLLYRLNILLGIVVLLLLIIWRHRVWRRLLIRLWISVNRDRLPVEIKRIFLLLLSAHVKWVVWRKRCNSLVKRLCLYWVNLPRYRRNRNYRGISISQWR